MYSTPRIYFRQTERKKRIEIERENRGEYLKV